MRSFPYRLVIIVHDDLTHTIITIIRIVINESFIKHVRLYKVSIVDHVILNHSSLSRRGGDWFLIKHGNLCVNLLIRV